MSDAAAAYWKARQDFIYYTVVRVIASNISKGKTSVLDVGSNGCPTLEWFDSMPDRTSLDLRKPYVADGITSHTEDFITWEPDRRYDVVTCLQTLEHVPNATAFARKLLAVGESVIVSVPYKWPEGKTRGHVHDPVDEDKMEEWFGRKPNFQYICTELMAPVERLICVYDPFERPWVSLRNREKVLQSPNKNAPRKKPQPANPPKAKGLWDKLRSRLPI